MNFARLVLMTLLVTLLAACARPPRTITPQDRAKAAETAQALEYFASRRMEVVDDGGRGDPVKLIDIKKWGDRYYVQYNAGRTLRGGENLIDVVQDCTGSLAKAPWLSCSLYNGVNTWNHLRITTADSNGTIADTTWFARARPMPIHPGQLRVQLSHSPAYGTFVARFVD